VSRTELKNVIRKECRSGRRRDRNSALTVARKMQDSGEKKQRATRLRQTARCAMSPPLVSSLVDERTQRTHWMRSASAPRSTACFLIARTSRSSAFTPITRSGCVTSNMAAHRLHGRHRPRRADARPSMRVDKSCPWFRRYCAACATSSIGAENGKCHRNRAEWGRLSSALRQRVGIARRETSIIAAGWSALKSRIRDHRHRSDPARMRSAFSMTASATDQPCANTRRFTL
jgi:hypothetical protein